MSIFVSQLQALPCMRPSSFGKLDNRTIMSLVFTVWNKRVDIPRRCVFGEHGLLDRLFVYDSVPVQSRRVQRRI